MAFVQSDFLLFVSQRIQLLTEESHHILQETILVNPFLDICLLQGYNLSTSRKLCVSWHESLVAGLSFLTHYTGVSTKHFGSTEARTAQANSVTQARSPPQRDLRAYI